VLDSCLCFSLTVCVVCSFFYLCFFLCFFACCSINWWWIKLLINVFHRNTANNKADVMSFGRLFHSFGRTEANDRSPTVTRRDERRVSWLEVDDRSRLRDSISATRLSRSDRYLGRNPVKSLVDNDRQIELDLLGSSSRQCKPARVSVTWAELMLIRIQNNAIKPVFVTERPKSVQGGSKNAVWEISLL